MTNGYFPANTGGGGGSLTGSQIKAAYEAEADTNAFRDADKSKLSGIFVSVADLLSDVQSFVEGDVLTTETEGFSYKVAPVSATDHHVATAGGVKLYVLEDTQGVVSLAQWGLQPGGDDIRAALQTAVDTFRSVFIPATTERTISGANSWYCSGTINVNREVRIFGVTGTQARVHPSSIRWDAGMPGIIFHYYDTQGDSTGAVTLNGTPDLQRKADGSRIETLSLLSGTGSDPAILDTVSHAIWAKVRIGVYDCFFSGWQGDGIHIVATASSTDPLVRGNANNWDTRGNRIQNCNNGMYIDGADANAGASFHDDCSSNAGWGVFESSFLGNTYVSHHTNGNGNPAKRQWKQSQYFCIDAANSAVTEPGTDPTVWWEYGVAGSGTAAIWASGTTYSTGDYVEASNGRVYKVATVGGGTSTNEPVFDGSTNQTLPDGYIWSPTQNDAWKLGIAVPEGGAKKVDGDSNVSALISCYDEGSQAASYKPNALSIMPGHGFDQEALGGSVMYTQKGWTRLPCIRTNDQNLQIEYELFGKIGSAKLAPIHLGQLDVPGVTGTQRVDLLDTQKGTVTRRDRNSDAYMTWMETLDTTTLSFGRGGGNTVPNALYVKRLFLGSNPPNARNVTFAKAEPTSGKWARGDIIFNQEPVAGGVFGWQCVTGGTAGSDAVFKAMGSLSA